MIKFLTKAINRPLSKLLLNALFSTRPTGQKRLELYKKIKAKDSGHINSPNLTQQILEKHYTNHRCDGCNSLLQSQDKQKYGYINEQVLTRAVGANIKLIESSYGARVDSSDSKTLQIVQDVQRELEVKIFNNRTRKLDNLDNVQVLLRLQEKIDEYEQSEQTIKRSKKQREEIYCYRCYSLKFHNKLPEEYDVVESLATNNQEQVMGKVLKKHKDLPVLYLYVVDILDLAGSLQKYVFDRLLDQRAEMAIVVNKLDIANEKYLNKHLVSQAVRTRLMQFVGVRMGGQRAQLAERVKNIKVFLTSNVSKVGINKLEEHIEKSMIRRIQLVGFPNTGKTTLLNSLARLNRPTSKVPGTTIFITESKYKKNLIYDMPGLYSQSNLYNLISKPNLKSMLAWNKFFSPPIMLNQALFFGGRVEVRDTKIILFGLGGACASDNRWFLLNYKEFWKGLPALGELQMTKYELDLIFKDGKAQDLEIAGWGFIGFRSSLAARAEETRKMTLFLPKSIQFRLRDSVLTDDEVFRYKSNVVKRFRLERIHEQKKEPSSKKRHDVV